MIQSIHNLTRSLYYMYYIIYNNVLLEFYVYILHHENIFYDWSLSRNEDIVKVRIFFYWLTYSCLLNAAFVHYIEIILRHLLQRMRGGIPRAFNRRRRKCSREKVSRKNLGSLRAHMMH